MSNLTCGFIGLGLIGGSIARALKQYDRTIRIVVYDINPSALSLAESEGVADVAAASVDERFSACDYLFLCAPVQKNDENLTAVSRILSKECILTDVGSVKSTIHEAVRAAGLEHCFIGGHPMAGSERTGFANSKAALLENAYYILTPTPYVAEKKVAAFRQLIADIGAIPLVLDCRAHDFVTAAVSHVPHVIASSLVNLVRDQDSPDGIMRMIAAGGFKDITRIASSSAGMWQQICLTNAENIVTLLDAYIASLSAVRNDIASRSGEAVYRFFDDARLYRDSFINASSGPIKRVFCVNVDIADRAGALAFIVTMLAEHNINLKNIGITHNRETEDGVLRIEFHDESGMDSAIQLLEANGYTLHSVS